GAQRLQPSKAREGNSTAKTVSPALIQSLKDSDTFVRRDAATALARLGPAAKEAVPALLLLKRDRHASVRNAAAKAVKKIDPETAAKEEGTLSRPGRGPQRASGAREHPAG